VSAAGDPADMAVRASTLSRLTALTACAGPGPWERSDFLGAGWSRQQVDRAVSGGVLVRLRHGLYGVSSDVVSLDVVGDATEPPHGVAVVDPREARAILRRLSSRAVLSHETAAGLQGLWIPWPQRSGLHVTIPGQAERRDGALIVHASRLPEEFVTTVDGMRVTSAARTAIDLARGRRLPEALVAVDGALRRRVLDSGVGVDRAIRRRKHDARVEADARAELEAAAAVVWSWPGSRVVTQAIELCDLASESPFESWSRGWFALSSIPAARINEPVAGASGRMYFGDFVWPHARLIGEADGFAKYGLSAADQRSRLLEQRRRQDDLEAAGWRIVRWTTGESGAVVTARVRRALATQG